MLGGVGQRHQFHVVVQSGEGEVGRPDQEGLRCVAGVACGPHFEMGLGAALARALGAVPVAHAHVAALHEVEGSPPVGVGGLGEVAALEVADQQGHRPAAGPLGQPHDPGHARGAHAHHEPPVGMCVEEPLHSVCRRLLAQSHNLGNLSGPGP